MLEVRANGPVFEVSGSLDADGAPQFLDAVRRSDGDVRVDGSGLQRVDGAGLTALVVARRVCRERGTDFAVVSVSPEAVRRLRARRELLRLFSPPADAGATDADGPAERSSAPAATPTRRRFTFSRGLHRRPRSRSVLQEDDHG